MKIREKWALVTHLVNKSWDKVWWYELEMKRLIKNNGCDRTENCKDDDLIWPNSDIQEGALIQRQQIFKNHMLNWLPTNKVIHNAMTHISTLIRIHYMSLRMETRMNFIGLFFYGGGGGVLTFRLLKRNNNQWHWQ